MNSALIKKETFEKLDLFKELLEKKEKVARVEAVKSLKISDDSFREFLVVATYYLPIYEENRGKKSFYGLMK